MKKCPTCGNEFEDSMKFCQVDGSPLEDGVPAFDPYATMVGHKLDVSSLKPKVEESPAGNIEAALSEVEELEAPPQEQIHETTGSIPIAPPNEVFDLPQFDPLKTMYVSPTELNEVFAADEQPPAEESVPEIIPSAPPPSPFSIPETSANVPVPPIGEIETVIAGPSVPPFEIPEPLRPDTSWQDQQIGANTPSNPSVVGVAAPDTTLALASVVCGIASCTLCFILGFFLGPVAIVLGLMAKKKIEENPAEFGGEGLATGGIGTGILGFLIGLVLMFWAVSRLYSLD